ncbi:glycerol uptake facilitator protein [Saccharopolyspora erythraea NRRL 2338]|uniref:Transport integral membrane protein n=2 Tax=Saccharopolyspora erythraea TaxID=1836 RepID=A4FHL8_SACEN|nr:MIP/aquaporin family protein [Saccharopolyspora erythraea]EQD81827.1 MIP family channel protein [Saccharopolyspora erythraea D]PFG97233.1 glycerol uptake facilitator protein [Saccharopolyspora erythraea NRRL 2338]QRK87427.1 aquaporin family protein [Saccharopolyspora erythraea]CAM03543.1 putative transport integral membrane protein [Saccharopolyspora erythraea NRRL 2338]
MAESGKGRRGYRAGLGGEMLAEFLGTFVLILLGCASVAVAVAGLPGSGRQADSFGAANWLIIAFGWGFAVVFGVYTAGGVSGAHINPAVSLALAVRRVFPWRKVVPYWIAQLVGAFVAAALVYAVYSWAIDAFNAKAGTPRNESLDTFAIFATFPAEYFGGSWWGPLLDQIVGTAVLLLLICALTDKRNSAPAANMAPYLIGMVVGVIGLTFGPNAGYAINPARDFGPRLWTFLTGWGDISLPGTYEWFSNYFWIPIIGPLIGGVIGALVYDLLISQVLTARGEEEPEAGRVP